MTRTAHPVDQRLPAGQLLTFGLQHVLAMYAGAVAVPLIVGGAMHLSTADIGYLVNADLLVSGVATLLQCLGVWVFGARLPIMQGCTFAAVTPMVMIGTTGGGLPAGYGAIILSGLMVVLIAPYFAKLTRFFPPVVTGTIILVIGVSLLPVAVGWAAGGTGSPGFGKPLNLAVAFGVLVLVVLVHRFVPGLLGRIAVLVGILFGTLAAIPLGLTDFSHVGGSPVVEITTPFHFGLPTFEPGAIVAFVIVMLVTMTETSGSVLAIGEIVDRPVDTVTLTRALRADGLSSLLGGVFNTFPYTAFGQNVGLVALTRVRSRYVVATAGGILVLMGLFPVLGEIVASVPTPVLGGAGIVMFGSVAAGGVRMLKQVSFDGNSNLMVIAVALGIGLVPVAAPTVYAQFPGWFQTIMNSGISAGSIAAVLLNLLFNGVRGDTQSSEAK